MIRSLSVVIIGITGGYGAGKTEVGTRLAKRGATVISADAIVHQLYIHNETLKTQLQERFGDEVMGIDGSINRRWLGELVFHDPHAREDVQALVHPYVRRAITDALYAASKPVVVVEIPLLVESGWQGFDLVIAVEATDATLVKRAQAGQIQPDWQQRRAIQTTDTARRQVAQYVVHNDGDVSELDHEIDKIWEKIVALPPRSENVPLPGPAA